MGSQYEKKVENYGASSSYLTQQRESEAAAHPSAVTLWSMQSSLLIGILIVIQMEGYLCGLNLAVH